MILVTGATGFVGRNFIAHQVAAGVKVRALIRAGRTPPLQHELLEWREGDVTDRNSLARCMDGVETVVHLAALLSSADEALNDAVNAEGTRTLLQLCRLHKVERFIFMSAAAAKFKHTNAYGRSKLRAEEIVASSALDTAILRLPLIIGRGSPEWERFVDFVRKVPGVIPVFGSGKTIKRQAYIGDVVAALAALVMRKLLGNRTWELACPDKMSLDGLIAAICIRLNLRKSVIHIPETASLLLAGFAEASMGPQAPLTRDIVRGLNEDVHLDTRPTIAELGLNPLPVTAAIDKALS